MKQQFRNVNFNQATIVKLAKIFGILEDYQKAGYVLTLRQLYYQLVARDVIPNKVTEYDKMCYLLGKARMGGIIDWSIIEDRTRRPSIPYWSHGISDAINDTIRQYRLDRMKYQDCYIEVWCEKDALSNVLKRVTNKYHVYLMVNRGYSSISAMYDSYHRFLRRYSEGKELNLIYVGDHDPSGLDMIRDVEDRLVEFGVNLNVNHLAITMDQIHQHNPPPNPAKITDPRADWYISEFGSSSWEVDALPPDVLNKLLEDEIKSLIDIDEYIKVLDEERDDIGELKEIADNYNRGE